MALRFRDIKVDKRTGRRLDRFDPEELLFNAGPLEGAEGDEAIDSISDDSEEKLTWLDTLSGDTDDIDEGSDSSDDEDGESMDVNQMETIKRARREGKKLMSDALFHLDSYKLLDVLSKEARKSDQSKSSSEMGKANRLVKKGAGAKSDVSSAVFRF